ncbi:MAG: hypothetical protein HC836_46895 [Richelia sp. RM2_1_2]|nr:hypothetical protein [Richelia sp. RM2_1_2]
MFEVWIELGDFPTEVEHFDTLRDAEEYAEIIKGYDLVTNVWINVKECRE